MQSGFPTVKMSPILFFYQLNLRLMDILIPDTSSLINIHEIYVGRVHIIDVLNQLFDVQVSREIPHEIRRNKDELGCYHKQMLQFARQARRYFHRDRDYEKLLFNQFAPKGNPNKNRGERYNCALALWLVRRQIGQVIMLTDDMNARRGFIDWYEKHFKTAKTWTSLDLLIHIYLVMFPKWPYAQADSALRRVHPQIFGKAPAEMMNHLSKYLGYLKQLDSMLKALPSVKKRGEL